MRWCKNTSDPTSEVVAELNRAATAKRECRCGEDQRPLDVSTFDVRRAICAACGSDLVCHEWTTRPADPPPAWLESWR